MTSTDKPLRIMGVNMDVTERKRIEEALKEADRRKDQFLATLAHELRNPLAPLRNGLELLKLAGGDEAMVGRTREMMERQLGHMVRLVDDLLDLSRISRGRIELRRERIELTRIIRQAVETSRPLIEQAGQDLTVTLAPQPIFVDADITAAGTSVLESAQQRSEVHPARRPHHACRRAAGE